MPFFTFTFPESGKGNKLCQVVFNTPDQFLSIGSAGSTFLYFI